MSERLRIYIAGPISKGVLSENIRQSREAMAALMRAGFAPFNPMLSCFAESDTPSVGAGFGHADWLGTDLAWVKVSDALLRLPGESRGADEEVAFAKANGIPVYDSVAAIVANPPRKKCDPRFMAIINEMVALHEKKMQDYGTAGDPYANVRASREFGVPPWVGALVRENDKTTRIKSFLAKGTLANESLEDSLIDKCVYSVIALLLYREANRPAASEPVPLIAQMVPGPSRRNGNGVLQEA